MEESVFSEDSDRESWDKLWSSQRYFRINMPLKMNLSKTFGTGGMSLETILSATISEDPQVYSDQVFRSSDECPICGQSTSESNRVAASLHPEIENGIKNISFRVWVHNTCLEGCQILHEPAPIPW